jgi:predicted nucleotidyltransferase
MMILGSLGCVDGLSFGCENPSLAMLKNAAEASKKASTPEKIRPLLEQGISYPQAVQEIIGLEAGPLVADVFDDPNNILAVEYIKSLEYLNLDIEILPIKRAGVSHDSDDTAENFASASKIRQMIEDGDDISAFVPKETLDTVNEYEENESLCYFENLERELLYLLRKAVPQQLAMLPDVGQGLENRLYEAGKGATSLDEFLELVKTKRYTMARIRRILLNLYIGALSSDQLMPPAFGRILAFNDRGVEIIKAARDKLEETPGRLTIPFSSDMKDLIASPVPAAKRFIQQTILSSDLYSLAARNISKSGSDFTAKVSKITTEELSEDPIPTPNIEVTQGGKAQE